MGSFQDRDKENGNEYPGTVGVTRKVKVKENFGNRNALTTDRHVH
jgi:hypothetical protein